MSINSNNKQGKDVMKNKGTLMGNVTRANEIENHNTQVEVQTKQSKIKRYPYNLGAKAQGENQSLTRVNSNRLGKNN